MEAAVGREDGWGSFYVGNAREWWGQFLDESRPVDDDGALPRAPDAAGGKSATLTKVPTVSLRTVLGAHEIVDLVNMDCQVGLGVRV